MGNLRGAVFGVVIQMCFSGRESEAWSYFDNHYNRSDRPRVWESRSCGDLNGSCSALHAGDGDHFEAEIAVAARVYLVFVVGSGVVEAILPAHYF